MNIWNRIKMFIGIVPPLNAVAGEDNKQPPVVSSPVIVNSCGHIRLGKLEDFTDLELLDIDKALELVNKSLSDSKFIDILMAAKFDNTDDSNEIIVSKITAPITVDNLFCENLGWYATKVDHTIAEESEDGSITFNRPFFDNQDGPSLANTLLHESCHKIGYSHISATDYLSVPYQAGNLLEEYLRQSIATQ